MVGLPAHRPSRAHTHAHTRYSLLLLLPATSLQRSSGPLHALPPQPGPPPETLMGHILGLFRAVTQISPFSQTSPETPHANLHKHTLSSRDFYFSKTLSHLAYYTFYLIMLFVTCPPPLDHKPWVWGRPGLFTTVTPARGIPSAEWKSCMLHEMRGVCTCPRGGQHTAVFPVSEERSLRS